MTRQDPTILNIPACNDCDYKHKSFFCNLTTPELSLISDKKSHSLIKEGQTIFYEGNHPLGLYCIRSGKVKIHKLGEAGKEQIVRFAKKGEILGYRAILSGEPYSATATALEDTQLCLITRDSFYELLKGNMEFSLKAIKLLTDDLKTAEQKLMNMAQKSVRERVAEALVALKECFGYKEGTNIIHTKMLRREIASLAGTTTETAIRMLSEFNKDKIICTDNHEIEIVNLPKLIRTANLLE